MKRKKKSRGNFLYLLKEAWRSKRILYLYFVLNRVYTDFVGGGDPYSQIFNRRADRRSESEDRDHDCCSLFCGNCGGRNDLSRCEGRI